MASAAGLAQPSESKLSENVARRFYNGRAIAQQGMGTAVPAAKHIAGYGQHVASLLERTARGDERAALLSRFDDDDGSSQAADDAVAEGEEPAPRPCARHQLGRDAAAHLYLSSERRVLGRVDDIDSRSEDADRASAGLERSAVRGRIDTPSQAADDSQPGGREIAGQLLRHIERVRRRAAGADNRNRRRAQGPGAPADPEDERRIRDGCERRRISGIAPRDGSRAHVTRHAENLGRESAKSRDGAGRRSGFCARELERGIRG